MILAAWIFVGVVALLATAGAVIAVDDAAAIPLGILGFLAWAYWAYGVFGLTIHTDSTVYTVESPALALLGVAMAILPGYVALTGPINLIGRFRNVETQEL